MTERYTEAGRWIPDNCIGALLNIAFEEEFDRDQCIKLLNQFKNHVFTVIDGKIKDVEKELEDYHLENENAMLVGRLWALKELKEELMENEEWLGIELEEVIL